jgi:hypothetical protein
VLPACYSTSMSNIQVKNVPEKLHAELRRRADEKGLTIRDYVLMLIEKDQRIPTKLQWLAELDAMRPEKLGRTSGVEAIRGAREEYEREWDAKAERLWGPSGDSDDASGP